MSTTTTQVQFYRYNQDNCEHKHLDTVSISEDFEVLPQTAEKYATWINVDGVHEPELVRSLGKHYNLHHLVIDDILNPNQRPKLEGYEDTLVIVTQMLGLEEGELSTEQLTIVLRKGMILTFQEHETWGGIFDPIRKRLTEGTGRTRKRQADYLMYTILDAIVDHNMLLIEELEEEAEKYEAALLSKIEPDDLQRIYFLRMKITGLRQKTRPTRELLRRLMEEEQTLIEKSTQVYLRDVHDHALRIADSVESLREMITGIIDLYSSQLNNRMSEIMKFLTMISAVFVPLNLIAAVYGMNFKNMPELNFKWGYFVVIGVMALIMCGMGVLYKRKGWF